MDERQRLRIAIIVPGGIGTGANNIGVPVLERQVRMLAKDFDITVFSLFPVNADYIPDGFQVISIPFRSTFRKSVALLHAFRKLHRQNKFVAIHGFWALPSGFLAVFIGKLFGIRSVVSVLGGDGASVPEINYGLLRKPLTRKLVLWTLTNATHPMALTQYLVDNLTRHGLKRKIVVVPWGIDTSLFSFKTRQISAPVKFLHIGNLTPVKDQTTLLRAFRIIRDNVDGHLTMIGEGTDYNKVINLVNELELKNDVTLLKPLAYESLPAYYDAADVLLHTSLSEGQSEVVTEAMSSGLLVCGTRVGVMFDVREGCLTADVGDHKHLATLVLEILKNHQAIDDCLMYARRWATQQDIHWTIDRTRQIYRAL
ncbi:glycosyltransferase [Pseudochryseolinea flava]|nr:glycosyltransferase [Pseudochryseolinea flava]